MMGECCLPQVHPNRPVLSHQIRIARRRHANGKRVKQKFDIHFGTTPVVLPEVWDSTRGRHVSLT
jgi:hypothetical protein